MKRRGSQITSERGFATQAKRVMATISREMGAEVRLLRLANPTTRQQREEAQRLKWKATLPKPPRTPLCFTRCGLLKRGWSRRLIDAILGEPDSKIPHRKFRQSVTVNLYEEARVIAAEQTPEFLAGCSKNVARRKKAIKAHEAKKAKRLERHQKDSGDPSDPNEPAGR